jgi:hypothetical protein
MMSRQGFYDWLISRVSDGGSGALTEVAEFSRQEDEGLMQRPASAALICWGAEGCAALAHNAKTTPTHKNLVSAIVMLSAVAAGTWSRPEIFYIDEDVLCQRLHKILAGGELRAVARAYLIEVLQDTPDDDLLISLGTAFQTLAMLAEHAVGELVRAMSSRWLKVGPTTVQEYERLIATAPASEPAFQDFFIHHPQFLDPMALAVWSQPNLHGAFKPDFLVRRADNSYVVVEIECPAKPVMTQAGQLSAEATHAEKQALEYRQFLNERIQEARQHFPSYGAAECLVVIGLEAGLNEKQQAGLAAANAARHGLRIVGFDWLARRASTVLENMSVGEIAVREGYRVI